MLRYPPVNPKLPHFWHGADYNPDQWPPAAWDEDMRLMKASHCNVAAIGIFSWAQLEPREGEYDFGWLDTVMDKLIANGCYAILATPSAAQPAWMSKKYPEILRTGPDRKRKLHGWRLNYCLTSPAYRAHCTRINRQLAERYRNHPALVLWHISNEYVGDCHCELCQAAFRGWLKRKYKSLDVLNQAWWTAFWGHTYSDWAEIESPGDNSIDGLTLDWNRFTTDQTVAFMKNEIAPLRELTPSVPVTTNMMATVRVDYWKFAPELDVISWDCYPSYHDRPDDWKHAVAMSFYHDLFRSMKGGRPFLLMESSPGSMNWVAVAKLKRPGVHRLGSLQAVAHGSDSVQYFQWRKGRGAHEKFHGAVVDNSGREESTAVFRDVTEVGQILEKLDPLIGTTVPSEVAVLYDYQNLWAIDAAAGPRKAGKDYLPTCQQHYRSFWSRGVPVRVLNEETDFSDCKLVIAPMLYMVRPGLAERIEKFVAAGGTFVTTYWSGIADENDLCFLGGRPGPLRKLLGIWSEDLDVLYDDEHNTVIPVKGNSLGLAGKYECRIFCDLIHAEGAEVLAAYGQDYYAGRPALTANKFGKGRAFYIASRNDDAFHEVFYSRLIAELGIKRALDAELPQGVTAQVRTDGKRRFVFLLNFTGDARKVQAGNACLTDLVSGATVGPKIPLPPFGSLVLECRKQD